jgi:hypothetical protein
MSDVYQPPADFSANAHFKNLDDYRALYQESYDDTDLSYGPGVRLHQGRDRVLPGWQDQHLPQLH